MPLTLVPTPLGHYDDITVRGRAALEGCDVVIAEEHRSASTLLKKLGLPQKEIYLLNEHSNKKDITELVELCRTQNAVLISDCGTPNFCDPGADLLRELRRHQVDIKALPGPSSLMMLLSLTSRRLNQFVFLGFLPAEREARQKAIQEAAQETRAQVILETPYRLSRLLDELKNHLPQRQALLALDLTLPTERVLEGTITELARLTQGQKAEPVLLIYPK